jgi:hypothetical protein
MQYSPASHHFLPPTSEVFSSAPTCDTPAINVLPFVFFLIPNPKVSYIISNACVYIYFRTVEDVLQMFHVLRKCENLLPLKRTTRRKPDYKAAEQKTSVQ